MRPHLPLWLSLAAMLFASPGAGAGPPEPATGGDAAAAFGRIQALEGDWEGVSASGRVHRVRYRPTAGGTALVETWSLGSGRESLTVYHLDGQRLLATHYCPQGNQPRLQWVGDDADGRMRFEFVDGTGLDAPGASHQHAFWLRVDGKDRYTRSETYVENGSGPREQVQAEPDPPVTYARIAVPAP